MTMFRTDDDLSTYTWVEIPEGTMVHCEPEPDSVLLIFGTHERTTLKLHPAMVGRLVTALGQQPERPGAGHQRQEDHQTEQDGEDQLPDARRHGPTPPKPGR